MPGIAASTVGTKIGKNFEEEDVLMYTTGVDNVSVLDRHLVKPRTYDQEFFHLLTTI